MVVALGNMLEDSRSGRAGGRLAVIVDPSLQFSIFNHIEILNFHLKISFVFVLGNSVIS